MENSLFSRLAPELRNVIWEYALTLPEPGVWTLILHGRKMRVIIHVWCGRLWEDVVVDIEVVARFTLSGTECGQHSA